MAWQLRRPGRRAAIAPIKCYGGLFADVQRAGIFPDQKTFPDCVPKRVAGRDPGRLTPRSQK